MLPGIHRQESSEHKIPLESSLKRYVMFKKMREGFTEYYISSDKCDMLVFVVSDSANVFW